MDQELKNEVGTEGHNLPVGEENISPSGGNGNRQATYFASDIAIKVNGNENHRLGRHFGLTRGIGKMGRPKNPESLSAAARDLGVSYSKLYKMVSRTEFPSALLYGHGRARKIRNRPQFFAWLDGFGLGRGAVESWRKYAYETGKKELSLEPEPYIEYGPAPNHLLADDIAALHIGQVKADMEAYQDLRKKRIEQLEEGLRNGLVK